MICKILAFFILPYLVISFKMDKKPAFKGELADLINAIQTDDQKAVEIEDHLMQAKNLNNVTSESSDRNQCQDAYVACPNYETWCSAQWFKENCKKTCDNCPEEGNKCAEIPSWMMNKLNFNSRIVGGSQAWRPIPWQVEVGNRCGGTILDEYTILTAAHCNIGSYDHVLAGVLSLKNHQFTYPPAQNIPVKNVIRHPNFVDYTDGYDYSIVKLREPLSFNINVEPACLPNSANFDIGDSALGSGWGGEEKDSGPYPDKLRFVALPIDPPSDCLKPSKLYLCAGSGGYSSVEWSGKGICGGDSGGPLVVPRSSSDNTAIVIGVTSFGTSDIQTGDCRQSIFAPVISELKWIKDNMGKP